MISYAPLVATLHRKGMSRTELRKAIGISTTTLARIGKNEPLGLETIDKICNFLSCPIEDVVEILLVSADKSDCMSEK